ncbi:F-box family protein [Dorcoceras hygrometricum]|uniref:F-box family protein n=1 Tax=Dorcoceras hygrometricum TaxID=472368 RepID=A0A2Z7C0V9_9LAMI|nr:F-box family protein [Dorcoceras hygrometricum]
MRIRPPELETSICDVKYHVSLVGKWVYLVTLAMSLFNLQDVFIVIGSLATLDLPMVVDLIGIYVVKGPYCTLTMTDWFLQALSPPPPPPILPRRRRAPRAAACAAAYRDRTCSYRRDEDIPFVSNLSVLLVQADERFVLSVMELIRRSTAAYLLKCRFPCEIGRSQAPRRQRGNNR